MDLVVAVEKAALQHLKADADVIASGLTVYAFDDAPAVPVKPFVKPGTPIASPYTGHRKRRQIRFTLYFRADATDAISARDRMGQCVSAVADALYRSRLPVQSGSVRFELVNDIRRLVDGESESIEANVEFRATVMAG